MTKKKLTSIYYYVFDKALEIITIGTTGMGNLFHSRRIVDPDIDIGYHITHLDQLKGSWNIATPKLKKQRARKMNKISISDYNSLFAKVEVGFEKILRDFTLREDITANFNQNEICKIYKANANEVLDGILEELGIEVQEEETSSLGDY